MVRVSSPNGIPTPGRRAPPRQATELGVVPGLRRSASTYLEASLRLAAQENDEIRPLAGFGAQALIRDDHRRARRSQTGNLLQDVGRNDNPVQCRFRAAGLA